MVNELEFAPRAGRKVQAPLALLKGRERAAQRGKEALARQKVSFGCAKLNAAL
ncbi:hypothetical protein ABIF66_002330 [Bradyrhizobium japonicum]